MEIFFSMIISLLLAKPLETKQENIKNYDNISQNTISTPSKAKEFTKENKEGNGMNPLAKDIIDAVSKFGSLISVFLAIYLAVDQAKKYRDERKSQAIKEEGQKQKELEEIAESRKQRQEDLRWRKASLAKDVLDELRNNSFCKDAMFMLDWNGRPYFIKDNQGEIKVERITHQEMLFALRTENKNFDYKEQYIRDCFDAFFENIQITQHYISINLIEFEDVIYPYDYYLKRMIVLDKNFEVFNKYLQTYNFTKAIEFFKQLEKKKS